MDPYAILHIPEPLVSLLGSPAVTRDGIVLYIGAHPCILSLRKTPGCRTTDPDCRPSGES
jgi:hypothetical protein